VLGFLPEKIFLAPVSEWPIIMSGPGGLLLVISYLFAVPLLVVMAGVRKK
jgi:hypothetical protein